MSPGNVLANPPVLWDIETDPVLAGAKMIAEAWDAAGVYQVGSFVGDAWKEWNGRFRDDVRSFLRAEEGAVRRVADRLIGSPEIFGHEKREAEQSVNFVTCHDGFTLNDLVSYDRKHNEENGEGNRDGSDDNRSWNCGVEGPTDDPAVERLRNRQVKNFLTVTLLSLGMPMILMGDEVRRTQRGNNNAYCHDDETTLVRLDAPRQARGRPPLRRPPRFPAGDCATRRPSCERIDLTELLRRAPFIFSGVRVRAARLERRLAQPRDHRGGPEGEALRPRHPERLLGAARVRAAAAVPGPAGRLAPLDRHGPRLAGRHRLVALGAAGLRPDVSRGGALRRRALRERLTERER